MEANHHLEIKKKKKNRPTFQLVNSIKLHTIKSVHLTISVILKAINSQKHILTEAVDMKPLANLSQCVFVITEGTF